MSANCIKAVLFDLDGTLIDTSADFIRIIGNMAERNGWLAPPAESIREQVSAGAGAMVTLLLTHNSQATDISNTQHYRQQFLADYDSDICVESHVYPELEPFLIYLKTLEIPWGIVTNKPRHLACKLLECLNLTQSCSVLVCPDDVRYTKPDPEPMYLALDKLGLPHNMANSVIYVGDHIRDIQAGRAAGMLTVLAGYGYIPSNDRYDLAAWKADYIAKTPETLVFLLRSPEFNYV